MKKLILFTALLISSQSYGYRKPELVARLGDVDAWNAPAGTWCFFSEPSLIGTKIYLPCFDVGGNFMASWDSSKEFKEEARTEFDQLFSKATDSFGKATWYEYNEFEVTRAFEDRMGSVEEIPLGRLTENGEFNTNFLPFSRSSYFYQIKGENPRLMKWSDGSPEVFFTKKVAHIFSPQVSNTGEVAFKTREGGLAEYFPDKIWLFKDNAWHMILEDNDSNPDSPWISFRHQLSVSNSKVVTVATSIFGESLILIDISGAVKTIAIRGVDLKNFEFFTVKMNKDVIAFRGEDMQGRKAVFVFTGNTLMKPLTQGDIVQTDIGPGRIHYPSKDSIFYGAPGIGNSGEIIQQATLTDPDFPTTLMGIGLIKIQK